MSKSVKLSKNAATTGTKKNIPMARSAGARKNAAARMLALPPIDEPPPLLEDDVDVSVEPCYAIRNGVHIHRNQLGIFPDFLGNLLPLRNLWSCLDVLQLLEKGARVRVRRKCRVLPCF